MRYLQNLLWLAVLCPITLLADATIADWPGVYTMNHDGHVGTLTITDTGRPCTVSQWCRLQASYKDSNGQVVPARITLIDQTSQHMVFFIMFPGNTQRFDAYLFSWDKTKLAGTTVWQGQTFGMFAAKASPEHIATPLRHRADAAIFARASRGPSIGSVLGSGGRCTPSGKPNTVVTANGGVELHYPDGSVKTWGGCGYNITCPDGSHVPVQCLRMEAIEPTPPPLPNDDATKTWLKHHNDSLMGIVTGLLGNDQASIQNYKNSYERGNLTLYQQMAARTRIIDQLTSH